jgi:eukaryotic-like serine/threonine-protein kinase
MSYCINPSCSNRRNANVEEYCQNCGNKLLIHDRYRLIEPLRPLEDAYLTEVFEAEDRGTIDRKVFKILKPSKESQKLVELFQQEAKILISLSHPGIPKADKDAYFKISLNNGQVLHCLVMEKITGKNLEYWIRENGAIAEEMAIDWLAQITRILDEVHKQKYFHRDIKPSNIMLKPNGQLVLIDFGTAREITPTVIEGKNCVTAVYSRGYTAPEQEKEKGIPQSDFFALGRTFVYLLTGKSPQELNISRTQQLIWRDKAPQISKIFKDLIDSFMALSPKDRPQNTKQILQSIDSINKTIITETEKRYPKKKWWIPLGFITSSLLGSFIGALIAINLLKGNPSISDRFTSINPNKSVNAIPIGDHLSSGEEILIPESETSEKHQGIEAYSLGKYNEAVLLLEKARQKQPNDPEVLIYLNNAWIEAKKVRYYTIAVAVPLSSHAHIGMEILRGVAQSQNKLVNDRKKIPSLALKVVIADDANNANQARQIAHRLTSQSEILAVIGHYASEITLSTIDIYEKHKLVLISPGSTTANLPQSGGKVFFRTVPTVRINTQRLASYLNNVKQKKVAFFYTSKSDFSLSFREQFFGSFFGGGKQIVAEFDLSNPFFNPSSAIDEAEKKGATAMVIVPDGGTSRYSIANAIRLIQANQGRLWMVGANTLESKDVLLLAKDVVERLVITIPWMAINSPNPEFSKEAQNLWPGGEVYSRAASAYDAAQALIEELTENCIKYRLYSTGSYWNNKFYAYR